MNNDKDEKYTGLNRRDFIKATGIGVAALSFGGAGLIYNSKPVSAATLSNEQIDTDILVVGGGIAATFAALKARESGLDVTMADKGRVGKSGLSPYWSGITVFDAERGDSKEEIMEGVAQTEEYLGNRTYTDLWIKHSKKCHEEMVSFGMFGPVGKNRGPARRKELENKGVRLIERTMITSLLTKDGRVVGAMGFPMEEEEKAIVINAKAVIMAAGSGTFKTPGWPGHSLTHDGDAMAYRVGAEITGKEFVDYHVTNAGDPGGFGVTQGGGLRVGNLSDRVGINNTRPQLSSDMAAHAGNYPAMRSGSDEEGRGSSESTEARPRMVAVGGSAAGMSPHDCEGVVPQNDRCESSVPGLYAAGDGLCTSGACYGIGGGSSSMSAVQGAVAGVSAAEYAKGVKKAVASSSDIDKAKMEMFGPRQRKQGFSPRWVTQVLQGIMVPYYVLSVKHEQRLKAALSTIEFLRDQFGDNLLANDIHELRLAHETENMLLNAEMRLKAGLFRTESRSSHFREDYPARDDDSWLAWVIIKADGSEMKLTKRPIPDEWKPSAKLSYKERYPVTRFLGEEEYLKGKGITL